MKKLLTVALLVVSSTSVVADDRIPSVVGEWQDCGPLNVVAVQAEHDDVLIQLENETDGWQVWKRIGVTQDDSVYDGLIPRQSRSQEADIEGNLTFNTSSHIMQFQSLAEKALLNDKQVIVRFEGDEVCHTDNYNSNAVMIRLIK
ncbi:hypothetical protein [Photobacterium damselae]|uniref:hypothetical protein n=1 Tax=Photobacterium damselae TaxID=38293 RepID=UPI0035A8361E